MTLANLARVFVVIGAVAAAAGSASSYGPSQPYQPNGQPGAYGQPGADGQPGAMGASSAPPARDMEPTRALGTWRSTFGAVKIEADKSRGGVEQGAVQGVWVYTRQGQEVIGYFSGNLRGNVMQFRWQEPNNPPLTGEGYLVFDPEGRQYTGRWWSDRRDRVGDWNGWRTGSAREPVQPQPPQDDADEDDGDDVEQKPAPAPVQPTYY